MKLTGYLGTYAGKGSLGLSALMVDDNTGDVSVQQLASIDNCKYLDVEHNKIYSIFSNAEGAGVCVLNENGEVESSIITEKSSSCYILKEGNYIHTANYSEGVWTIVEINENGLSLFKQIVIKKNAGCHQVYKDEHRYYIPCLLMDEIQVYDEQFNYLRSLSFKTNQGPRHMIRYGDDYLIVCELSNELVLMDKEGFVKSSVSVLKDGVMNKEGGAAIRQHPTHNDLFYVSTRSKENVLSVLKVNDTITLEQVVDCGGDHPRDFNITPNGKFCISLNRNSANVVVFAIDEHGLIDKEVNRISVSEAVSLEWKE